jgi:hypothetical protein
VEKPVSQNLPFKCNLQRYAAALENMKVHVLQGRLKKTGLAVGRCTLESS